VSDLIGTTLQDKYFLRELIGRGRMANVYLAWDKLRTSELAVKVLHSELSGESRFLNMFKKETKFMRELPHPNIVRLYDFGIEKRGAEKIVFIVMDYKKGCDLRRFLVRRGQPLSIDEVSQALAAVCKALYFAHQSKVLHCDVKSANILLSHDEKTAIFEKDVFLTDFGISRWTMEHEGGGTPAYMAPELFQGGAVNEKTEIYALGVTLYEMLSGGQLPYQGDSSSPGSTARERIAWEKQYKPLPPLQQLNPALSNEIVSIVDKALNKDVALRHATIIDVWYEFENTRNQQNITPMSDKKTVISPPQPQPRPAAPQEPAPLLQTTRRINQPHIYGIRGEKAGQEFSIFNQGLTIGRAQKNQLRLVDRTVSRIHAKIIRTRRAFYIQDETSTLGTYVNGLRIPPNKPILIKDGDRIEIGNSQIFEFRLK
jgi:serine/threonine protein kinase